VIAAPEVCHHREFPRLRYRAFALYIYLNLKRASFVSRASQ